MTTRRKKFTPQQRFHEKSIRLGLFDSDKRKVQRGDFAMFSKEGDRAVAIVVRDIKSRMKGKSLEQKFQAAMKRFDKFPRKFAEVMDTQVRELIFVALATRGQFKDHIEERIA